MFWKIAAILILLVFYSIYIGKMLLQRKQGIRSSFAFTVVTMQDSWRAGIAKVDHRIIFFIVFVAMKYVGCLSCPTIRERDTGADL